MRLKIINHKIQNQRLLDENLVKIYKWDYKKDNKIEIKKVLRANKELNPQSE
jgi:hypothetical protein